METLRIQKRLFYLIIALLLIGTVVLLISLNLPAEKQQVPLPSPTPAKPSRAADIQQSETYKESLKEIDAQQKTFLNHEAVVGQLIKKLPYKSSTFSMEYSFTTNRFTVIFLTSQGEADFTAFLRANGIEDKSWIRNLRIVDVP